MNIPAQFPPKPQNKFFYFAHNPEDENDARTFRDETEAFDHFLSYWRFYRYTAINEAERTCEFLDEEFEVRRDEMQADVQAENADRFYQFCREMDGVA